MMRRFCLLLSRLCLASWVGTALFFVTAILSLRGSPLFSDAVKLSHPKVLFPLYYLFEFWLLGGTLALGLVASGAAAARKWSFRAAMSLVACALLIAIADYLWVYHPLAAMLDLETMPPEFAKYHTLSRWINTAGTALSLGAAILLLWPRGNE